MTKERRQYLRVKERHKVHMTVKSSTGGETAGKAEFVGWTDNISVGGLSLTSHKMLPVGEDVDLHIECTHPLESYEIGGRVMWCTQESGTQSAQAGIYVQETPREAFLEWSRMVARRAE